MAIKGGYILQPRCIDESEVMHNPPIDRELWAYILRRVNHADNKGIMRGQGLFRFSDIQEDLHWCVGYRKETYSKPQLTKSLRRLCEGNMIETAKETRGILITVCNYEYYQDPQNYEGNGEETTKEARRKEKGHTINKNDKNDKNTSSNEDDIDATSDPLDSTTDERTPPPVPAAPLPRPEPVNYRDLVIFFNAETRGVFGNITYPLSEKRKSQVRARIREHGKDAFARMIRMAARSDFLKGDKGDFKATFDWLIKPTNFEKVLSGNYDNSKKGGRSSPADDERLMQNIAAGFQRGLKEREERELRDQPLP